MSGLRTEPLGPAVPCWAAILRQAPPHLLTLLRRWLRRSFLVQAALARGRQTMHPKQTKRQRSGALGSCCASRCLRSACGWSTRTNPCYSAYGFFNNINTCKLLHLELQVTLLMLGMPIAIPCRPLSLCLDVRASKHASGCRAAEPCSWHQGTAAPAWLCGEQSCQKIAARCSEPSPPEHEQWLPAPAQK